MEISSKERILAAMDHKVADRAPVWESFWGSTLERWKGEGLPADADVVSYFGLDPCCMTSVDWSAQFPGELIEETDEYVISRTSNGALQKSLKGHDGTPAWWDFQLTDRASWEDIRPRLAWNETRVDLATAKKANDDSRNEFRVYMPACCGFEVFKYLMGMEGILIAIAEDPDWVREMVMVTADYCIGGLEYLLGNGLEFDACFITEDMGFKGRSFFSPATYREVIMPAQKKLCDAAHARGLKMLLHT
ncbi:MAG: uroporphyrinogen decarboxylase family protein, partial [Armatimonadota bacterium]